MSTVARVTDMGEFANQLWVLITGVIVGSGGCMCFSALVFLLLAIPMIRARMKKGELVRAMRMAAEQERHEQKSTDTKANLN